MWYTTTHVVSSDTTTDLHELFVLFSQLKLLEFSPFLKNMNVYMYSYDKYFTIFVSLWYQTYNH